MKPNRRAVLLALAAMSSVALAHHSYSAFDRTRTQTIQGVVRTWEFSNPHAHLWLYVDDAQGKPQLWGIEAPGPTALLRNGWNKYTVKPGDRITLLINPLADGRNGGNMLKLTLADGRTLDVGPLPGAAGGPGALNDGPGGGSNAP